MSSWNIKCGIAEYTRYMRGALESAGVKTEIFSNTAGPTLGADGPLVFRCWDNSVGTLHLLLRSLQERRINHLLIQYHDGFYPPEVLASLIFQLEAIRVRVFVIHHMTQYKGLPKIVAALGRVELNLVHSGEDIERLRVLGLNNLAPLPHGIVAVPDEGTERVPSDGMFRVGGFGFLMPHKGFLELICAGYLLRRHIPGLRVEIFASVYPSLSSEKFVTRCREYIRFLRCSEYVHLETGYLGIADVSSRLRRCNLIAFPYQYTTESSSAAVRVGLATRRPVLCTPLAIFRDVAEAITYTKGFDALAISDTILEMFRNPKLLYDRDKSQNDYLQTHSWNNVALQLLEEMAVRPPVACAATAG